MFFWNLAPWKTLLKLEKCGNRAYLSHGDAQEIHRPRRQLVENVILSRTLAGSELTWILWGQQEFWVLYVILKVTAHVF